jgi:CRP-like cAMP-binding protein
MNSAKSASSLFSKRLSQVISPKPMPPEKLKHSTLSKSLEHAFILQSKGLYDSAISVYERIAVSHPQNLSSRVNLSVCLIKLSMFERAFSILTQASQLSQHNLFIVYNKALALYMMANRALALQILNEETGHIDAPEISELKEIISKDINKTLMAKQNRSMELKKLAKTQTLFEITKKKATIKKPHIVIYNPSTPSSSELSLDSSSKMEKSSKTNEFSSRPDITTRTLTEKSARLSIRINAPQFTTRSDHSEGFFQESIDQATDKPYSENPHRYNILIEAPLSPSHLTSEQSFEYMSETKLSQKDLKFIINEFKKPINQRLYSELSKKLSKLPFFVKFPIITQERLIEISKLAFYRTGEVIIKQGELGECMFIILSGSVVIYRQTAEYRNLNIIVNSMYDGEAFGELALLSNPKESDIRRTASCVAAEPSLVLSISKKDYKDTVLDKLHQSMVEAIKFIKGLKIFASQPWVSLVPFASSLKIHTFGVGDVILEQGEVPKGMYIVYSGRCKVYWEGYVKKGAKTDRVLEKQKFVTGNYEKFVQSPRVDEFHMGEDIKDVFYRNLKDENRKAEEAKGRIYLTRQGGKVKNIEKRRIEHKIIKEGDYFAGRAILGKSHIEPSKFTIVSESHEVKIFIVEKRNLNYLGEDFYV